MEGGLEISQLRYFLALCEQRSFTRAAEQCGVSQPSLSNAIRALEIEFGGPLIERSPFSLTPLGKAVRPQFRSALRHIALATTIAETQTSSEAIAPQPISHPSTTDRHGIRRRASEAGASCPTAASWSPNHEHAAPTRGQRAKPTSAREDSFVGIFRCTTRRFAIVRCRCATRKTATTLLR